jgi:hypothetical protein
MEIPFDVDVESLETAVDRAARSLYFGRPDSARVILSELLPRFPCVALLMDRIG